VTHGSNEVGRTGARSLNQTLALVFGAVYTLVALIGFFVADTFADTGIDPEEGKILGIFEVNHLHNLVHLLIGLALLAASRRHDTARGANLAIGATYLVVGLLGLFLLDSDANILALNGADNVLHLLSGALLAGVALTQDKNRAHTGTV
jgi:hypothetical protein